VPLLDAPVRSTTPVQTPPDAVFALLWLIGAACALGAATQAKFHRLAALILVGGAGLVTSLTFAWFSAPDLALTQFAVEIVMTVLLLLGLRWLPRRIVYDEQRRQGVEARVRRARDFVVALVVGAGLAMLSHAIMTRPSPDGLAAFFLENSVPHGHGHNVVNVIIVDFRALDTLGEITVLCVVALTVFAMLRRFRPAPETLNVPRAQREEAARFAVAAGRDLPTGAMLVPATIGRLLLPLAGVVSVYFLLRGHNAPGGGFVGGLVMATAIILQYMTSGVLWVESQLRVLPQYWVATGLIAAGVAGVLAWLVGAPFLTSLEWHATVPLLGELHLSTVLLFDLGVYMVVVGSTVLILIAIAHQSLREPRRPSMRRGDAAVALAEAER
jgi:multicomponent K+:H+ antiporter subunit A